MIPLWTEPCPHSLGVTEKDVPFLIPHLPEKTVEPAGAIIVCPGGGYRALMMDHEGNHVADYFRSRNLAAFVLRYRLPTDGYRHPVPMLDGQRAIRLLRTRAKEWNIDPAKIGVMGFSAGGHLASTLATHFDSGDACSVDPVNRSSCRPDFAVLIYAVNSLKEGMADKGNSTNLFGPDADPKLIANFCNEDQVTSQTSPTYLLHAVDDEKVPIENSRVMFAALQKAGVSSELNESSYGRHGFGFGLAPDPGPAGWMDQLFAWLRHQGFAR